MHVRSPIWLFPNLLSLDAPLVAVAWQGLLAVETGLPLHFTGRFVLGLTVWLIYVADRLLDVRDPERVPRTARHYFYRDHRNAAIALLAAITIADLFLIVFNLRHSVFVGGLGASVGVLMYLAALHGRRGLRLPKELVVALLFAAGTFVVAWAGSRHPISELGLKALAFFFLCLANLVLIERWESGEVADGNWITVALSRFYPFWVPALVLASLFGVHSIWYRAIAISASASYALFLVGEGASINLRRALVDAVMLSPVLFLL